MTLTEAVFLSNGEATFEELFGFTASDLEANRRGEISPAQMEKQRAEAKDNAGCLVLAGIVCVAPAVLVMFVTRNTLLAAAAWGIAFLVLGYQIWDLSRKQLKALDEAQVMRAEGAVTKRTSWHYAKKATSQSNTRVTTHYVSFGGTELQMFEAQYDAFKEGHTYAVYYIPWEPRPRILSAEEIEA